MRKLPPVAEEQLRACLQEQYNLNCITLEFLPVGLDFNAGVYRVLSEQGTVTLLKVTSRPLYTARYLIPRYLNDQGITSVVAPLPTRSGALWATLGEWTLIVYPFIDGDSSFTGMTNEQWQELGSIFKHIHQAPIPAAGFASLRRETFDPGEYTRWIHAFETKHVHAPARDSEAAQALCADWLAHRPLIHTAMAFLDRLAAVLQARTVPTVPYVICHADLHPANLRRTPAGHVHVIDWDDVMLAPRERDFIFIWEPQADAFFRGYGQIQIDWVTLTYYRWERVIQDVIEDARNVCFRDDLAEETKAEIAQTFHESLKAPGNINAAYAAAAHLPSDLIIHQG